MRLTSEPQARPRRWRRRARGGAARPGRGPRTDDPHEDLLALLNLAADDLGGAPVGDAERERDGLRLSVRSQGEHASLADRARPAILGLVVLRLLFRREDLADLGAGRLADALTARLPLGLGEVHAAE